MITLENVVSQIESSNNHLAVRYEPTLFSAKELWVLNTLPKVQRANPGISYDTALMIACTSLGLYQCLGANIYALGYGKTWAEFATDPVAQDGIFIQFLKPAGFTSLEDVTLWDDVRFGKFATFQNGPGNVQAYVSKMKQIIAKGVTK